jgi:hypothetical protein
MRSGVRTQADLDRSGELFVSVAGGPSIDPSIRDGGSVFATEPDRDAKQDFREIDCVRRRLSGKVIAAAELRAAGLATGADRVLITSGALDEETYLRALGETTGVMFEPLDGKARAQCPLDDDRLIDAAATGLLPLVIDDALVVVVAPRGVAARRILAMIEDAAGNRGALSLHHRGTLQSFYIARRRPATDGERMLSLAAWRALYQLFFAPYRWEKTAHGLAKSSHRADKITRALLALERELVELRKNGELPAIGAATNTFAARQRRLRGFASD